MLIDVNDKNSTAFKFDLKIDQRADWKIPHLLRVLRHAADSMYRIYISAVNPLLGPILCKISWNAFESPNVVEDPSSKEKMKLLQIEHKVQESNRSMFQI